MKGPAVRIRLLLYSPMIPSASWMISIPPVTAVKSSPDSLSRGTTAANAIAVLLASRYKASVRSAFFRFMTVLTEKTNPSVALKNVMQAME